MKHATAVRLYVTPDLSDGGSVPLVREQSHRLRTVLRLKPGVELLVYNGRDGEWAARVETLDRTGGEIVLTERLRPQAAEPGPTLVFSPLKKAQTDFLVQKAVELGVRVLQPVVAARTQSIRVNPERMAVNAREASEQCGRLTVPEVRELTLLPDAIKGFRGAAPVFLCAESGDAAPLGEVLEDLKDAEPPVFVVGPEGGFAPSELDGLRERPFITPVNLGPRILRAETAALAALVCWQSVAGDWRERPPYR